MFLSYHSSHRQAQQTKMKTQLQGLQQLLKMRPSLGLKYNLTQRLISQVLRNLKPRFSVRKCLLLSQWTVYQRLLSLMLSTKAIQQRLTCLELMRIFVKHHLNRAWTRFPLHTRAIKARKLAKSLMLNLHNLAKQEVYLEQNQGR